MVTTRKKPKRKPVTVARSSPSSAAYKRVVADMQRVIAEAQPGHYSDMPWCDLCQAYHMPTAPHIRYGDAQPPYQGMKILTQPMHTPTLHVILVGDIVSGFEVYGPFQSGHDAVTWKQQTGNRERTQGQWFLMPLKTP